MRQRQRKLAGTVILLIVLTIYALAAMVLGAVLIPQLSNVGVFLFHAAAGLMWIVPAAFLVKWMQRPDEGG
jgi:hypothetical protein